jgi:hypothetical protein
MYGMAMIAKPKLIFPLILAAIIFRFDVHPVIALA